MGEDTFNVKGLRRGLVLEGGVDLDVDVGSGGNKIFCDTTVDGGLLRRSD